MEKWNSICELLDNYKNNFDCKTLKTDSSYRIHFPSMEKRFVVSINEKNIIIEIEDHQKEYICISTDIGNIISCVINVFQQYRMLYMHSSISSDMSSGHIPDMSSGHIPDIFLSGRHTYMSVIIPVDLNNK